MEVVIAAELSNDPVLKHEILSKVDIHANNQAYFKFPPGKEGRLVAKVLKFRIIYGGTEFAFSKDPDFMPTSTSVLYWRKVINQYYDKYKGIANWHKNQIQLVKNQGFLEIPSGRVYNFEPKPGKFGGLEWPLTIIKNYPVQGFGADLVMLARIELDRLIQESGLEALIVMTIHDSLMVDCPKENVDAVAKMISQAIDSAPTLCYTIWNYKFQLPLTSEISVGHNKKELHEYHYHVS